MFRGFQYDVQRKLRPYSPRPWRYPFPASSEGSRGTPVRLLPIIKHAPSEQHGDEMDGKISAARIEMDAERQGGWGGGGSFTNCRLVGRKEERLGGIDVTFALLLLQLPLPSVNSFRSHLAGARLSYYAYILGFFYRRLGSFGCELPKRYDNRFSDRSSVRNLGSTL